MARNAADAARSARPQGENFHEMFGLRCSRPLALAIVLQRIGQPHHDDRQAGDVYGARLPPEHARDDNGDGNSQYGPNEKKDERVHDDDPPDASMRSMVWQPNCRQPPFYSTLHGVSIPDCASA